MKAYLFAGTIAAVGLFAQPLAASGFIEEASSQCLPTAEFDAAFGPQVRAGQQIVETSQYAGQRLCSGETFAQRLQELRKLYFPQEDANRQRVRAEMAAEDRREREAIEAREALWAEREERLAEAEYRADLAEAGWREEMARAKQAEARLTRAEAERALAALPPGRIRQSVFLQAAEPANTAALERMVEAVVREDAESWRLNGYKQGSLFDTQLRSYDAANANYVVFSRFKYTNQNTGWVEVEYAGNRFQCLKFHNDGGECRDIGDSLSMRRISGFAGAVLASWLPSPFRRR